MFKGSLFVTTDRMMALNSIATTKVVIMGQHDEELMNYGALMGGVLTPPYNAMAANLDGNMQEFMMIYSAYLNSKEPTAFISTIFRALMNGTNILLYLTQDEHDIYFPSFVQYIANNFGVIIGSQFNPFDCSHANVCLIYSLMYAEELLSAQEFFELYPAGVEIFDFIVPKLNYELNPNIRDKSIQGLKMYFFELKERIKANHNRYLPNPIQRNQRSGALC